ncbi:MAG: hypothetical protein VB124_05495 [Burkholderia sp.]
MGINVNRSLARPIYATTPCWINNATTPDTARLCSRISGTEH